MNPTSSIEWVLLVHQLPARPTRLRVRVWRQLQKLGAVALKNSVYILPFQERTHEDFQWLRQEIVSAGGEASVFRAGTVEGKNTEEIKEMFRRTRDQEYTRLAAELESLAATVRARNRGGHRLPRRMGAASTELDRLHQELERVRAVDYFRARGYAAADAAYEKCRRVVHGSSEHTGRGAAQRARDRAAAIPGRYQNKVWVTRREAHIDRLACAWLIRRFIDRRARFRFVSADDPIRQGIPFDTFGAELGHHGEDCTFETMLKKFGLVQDPALRALAEIVHDMDLKDSKFNRREPAGLNAVVHGLARVFPDDQQRVRRAFPVFESLYAFFRSSEAAGVRSDGRRSASRD